MAFSKLRGVRRPWESSSRLGLIVRGCVDANRRPRVIFVLLRTVLVEQKAREGIIGVEEVKWNVFGVYHKVPSVGRVYYY